MLFRSTVAHSFIEFFPTEFDAFKAFADTYPDSVSLLLDTYNIMESGLPNLIKLDDYLIEKYPNDPNSTFLPGISSWGINPLPGT